MDKETKQYYEQTLKQFGGDEKRMTEHFKKVIEYQKKKKQIANFVFGGQEPSEETMNEALQIMDDFTKKLKLFKNKFV